MPTRFAIDEHIGLRLRQRRRLLGMTQKALADACGLRFQQIQKYEYGEAAIGAARLWQIAQVTSTTIGYFFQGLDPSGRDQCEAEQRLGDLLRTFAHLDDARREALLEQVRRMTPTLGES